MKELLIQLRTLNEGKKVKVSYEGSEDIPYNYFTHETVGDKSLVFEFNTPDTRYSFVLNVPKKEDAKITWVINKVSEDGSNWQMVESGRLRKLNNLQSLISSLTKELENELW